MTKRLIGEAVAAVGLTIGDQIVLSLQGTDFVPRSLTDIPERTIDWELSYADNGVVQVFRDGKEIANIDTAHVSCSPTHTRCQVAGVLVETLLQWHVGVLLRIMGNLYPICSWATS